MAPKKMVQRPLSFQKKKKNEEQNTRTRNDEVDTTGVEVITIDDSSTTSDDPKRTDDSASSPLGGQNVDSVKTPYATMGLRKEEEDTKKKPVEEEKKGGGKRKKGGVGAKTKTSAEEMVMSSPDSAEKKRAERGKKAKEEEEEDDDDDVDDDDSDFEMMVYPEKKSGTAGSKSGVSKTPARRAALAVKPKKTKKAPAKKAKKTENVTEQAQKKGSHWSAKETTAYVRIRALVLKELLHRQQYTALKLGSMVFNIMNIDETFCDSMRDTKDRNKLLRENLVRYACFQKVNSNGEEDDKDEFRKKVFWKDDTSDASVENAESVLEYYQAESVLGIFDYDTFYQYRSEQIERVNDKTHKVITREAEIEERRTGRLNIEAALKKLSEISAVVKTSWWTKIEDRHSFQHIANFQHEVALRKDYKREVERLCARESEKQESLAKIFQEAKVACEEWESALNKELEGEMLETSSKELETTAIGKQRACRRYVLKLYILDAGGNFELAKNILDQCSANKVEDISEIPKIARQNIPTYLSLKKFYGDDGKEELEKMLPRVLEFVDREVSDFWKYERKKKLLDPPSDFEDDEFSEKFLKEYRPKSRNVLHNEARRAEHYI